MRIKRELLKKIVMIFLIFLFLGAGIFVYDLMNTKIDSNETLKRNSAGMGKTSNQLVVSYLNQEETLDVEVSDRELLPDEVKKAFKKAKKEIDKTYLGENKSSDEVCFDLDLRQSYVDGLINVNWQMDNYMVIHSDGKINHENTTDKGDIVAVKAEMNYAEYQQIYSFSIMVKALDTSSKEGQRKAVMDAVKASDKATITEDYMKLPQKASDLKLTWKRKLDYRGLVIVGLGIAISVGLYFAEKEEKKKEQLLRKKELETQYPLIVSELSILMCAGMSFRGAIERISASYQKKKNNGIVKEGYEEILKTYRQLNEGVGEVAAIENLGNRAGQKDYRRLAMMLTQSIKKGSRDLIDNLEKEEAYAFDMRKMAAKKAGEEASTKLLLPMGGMLLIVIMILVVPALMQINV